MIIDKIKALCPQLTKTDFDPIYGTILLQDDSDGKGPYIKSWKNAYPQPTQAQLDAISELGEK